MEIERRFIFRGNAAPIGGRISRPRELVLEAGGASSLTVVGGRSRGELPRTSFGDFVSIRSAASSAEGLFDDRRRARELTQGKVREEVLPSTTTVNVDVRELVVGDSPALRIEQLRATVTAASPGPSGEPSIKPSDLRIAGIDIGGYALVVELETDMFGKYDTRARLLAAADDRAFIEKYGGNFLMTGGAAGRGTRQALQSSDGTIYATVVRKIRWKGRPYPGSTIDQHLVIVPDFGRIYFGEIFITAVSRRLTLVRLQLGSPIGGAVACGEVETNGSWYP